VTAREQTAGRGRQGRTWSAPRDRALLCSLVLRDPPRLLPLAAGVAVAEVVAVSLADEADTGAPTVGEALIKWPNDVLLDGRKVAGILVEGRPQERWAVVGMGINVALRAEDFPAELRASAGTLGLWPERIESVLSRLLVALERWLVAPADQILDAVRLRDALLRRPLRWAGGEGRGAGIDGDGRLVVATAQGHVSLDAGEVHLEV
jgi:BirA family transcriptional regulator, biotin operon repressor / biotin---[acetyl-CoA-carboxylase] ligase